MTNKEIYYRSNIKKKLSTIELISNNDQYFRATEYLITSLQSNLLNYHLFYSNDDELRHCNMIMTTQ